MSASPSVPPPLPTATAPEDRAADEALAQTLDTELAKPAYKDLRSMIVLAHGRTVYERYFGSLPEDRHQVWSVTKSVVGTLVGIALEQGKISGLDATLGTLLPDHADRMTPGQAEVTLERLLTMTGGFVDEPPGMDGQQGHDDWIASTLEYSSATPKERFSYSSGTSHLLAAILEEATGESVLDYAREVLFDPLGIVTQPAEQPVATLKDVAVLDGPGFAWATDPQARNLGPYGLRLRAQDLAALGLLYLHDGVWKGEQVVPKTWVREATSDQVEDEEGYGFQWWTGDQGFAAEGYGGQRIWVLPEDEIVYVTQIWIDPTIGKEQLVAGEVGELFDSTIYPAIAGPAPS